MAACKNCGRKFPDGKTVMCFCTGGSLFDIDQQTTEVRQVEIPLIPVKVYSTTDGPEIWGKLHSYKYTTEEDARLFFDEWMLTVPSFGCSCKAHWAHILIELPPDFSSAQKFFKWSVDAHNLVNQRLSKPQFSYEDALVKYGQDLRID